MTDITIPPEAAKALAMAILEITGEGMCMDEARAACLAMLKAWPDSYRITLDYTNGPTPMLVLPLPTENTNAEG